VNCTIEVLIGADILVHVYFRPGAALQLQSHDKFRKCFSSFRDQKKLLVPSQTARYYQHDLERDCLLQTHFSLPQSTKFLRNSGATSGRGFGVDKRVQNAEFDRWVDVFTADWVRHHPVLATTQQYFEGPEQDALDRQLTLAFSLVGTYGVRAAQVQVVLAQRGLAELRAFSPANLTDVQRTSAAVIEQRLEAAIAGAKFAKHRFIFNQIVGLHVMLVNFLSTIHPIRGERDAENYLARLALVPGCLDEGVGEARDAAAAMIVPPRFILERTIEQLDTLMSGDLARHALVATFERRLAELTAVSAERRAKFVAAALSCVRDRIVPAFGRVRPMLVEQLACARSRASRLRWMTCFDESAMPTVRYKHASTK
jgi:uncharacterized protein (DUF885 family)